MALLPDAVSSLAASRSAVVVVRQLRARATNDVTVATRLPQGCSPIGAKHVITQAQRNVIITLDERPALEQPLL